MRKLLRPIQPFVGLVLAIPTLASAAKATSGPPRSIVYGRVAEGRLLPGREDRLSSHVEAGAVLRVDVHQEHVNVRVSVVGPDGRPLGAADNEADRLEPIRLEIRTTVAGPHEIRLGLVGPSAVPRRYGLVVSAPRVATAADDRRFESQSLLAEGDRWLVEGREDSFRRAAEAYERAADLHMEVGDDLDAAWDLCRAAEARLRLGSSGEALCDAETALHLARRVGNGRAAGIALLETGNGLLKLGRTREALAVLETSREVRRSAGDAMGEAESANSIAVAHLQLGEPSAAIAEFAGALEEYRTEGDRWCEAYVLKNRGAALADIGEFDRSRRDLAASRRLFRVLGDRWGEGGVLLSSGTTELASGNVRRALRHYQAALRLLMQREDDHVQAIVRNRLGLALVEAGRASSALDEFAKADAILERLGDSRLRAVVEANAARALLRRGDSEAARRRLEKVLPPLRQAGARLEVAGALVDLALAERSAGGLHAARARLTEALEITEALRESIPAVESRTSYLAAVRKRYQLLVDVLMDLHAREPGRGWEVRALEASERSKARGLGDVVSERTPSSGAEGSPTRGVSIDAIRAALDTETLVLEYSLGESRSFLWAVTRDSVESYVLPARRRLESLAKRVFEAWRRPGAPERLPEARELSRLLLGPVAHGLRANRLAVVAPGALQYLPFDALPSVRPGRVDEPLLADHEVVTVPSIATLIAMRQRESTRERPEDRVVVLADPVFDPADERVSGASRPAPRAVLGAELRRSLAEFGRNRLDRLPATRREAEAIAAFAGPGRSLVALDFDARRSFALGEEVARARIVHFASHAVLNLRHPELSGIVLSLVDDKGRPADGFLPLRDVSGLRLSAELVVLSACESAIGREIEGEGLVGLARGFMNAGASRVLASSWQVSDRATAALMTSFYERLFEGRRRPAAALRESRLQVRREPRWRSPYYWAGFSLQGDWR